VAGVVYLGIPIHDRAHIGAGVEPRGDGGYATSAQMSVMGKRIVATLGEQVVQTNTSSDIGPFPQSMLERIEKRDWADQVRSQEINE
jgi:hypothetical protein